MAVSTIYCVFVNSTFSDLKTELNAMQAHVFPPLPELCEQYGYRFRSMDLSEKRQRGGYE